MLKKDEAKALLLDGGQLRITRPHMGLRGYARVEHSSGNQQTDEYVRYPTAKILRAELGMTRVGPTPTPFALTVTYTVPRSARKGAKA